MFIELLTSYLWFQKYDGGHSLGLDESYPMKVKDLKIVLWLVSY